MAMDGRTIKPELHSRSPLIVPVSQVLPPGQNVASTAHGTDGARYRIDSVVMGSRTEIARFDCPSDIVLLFQSTTLVQRKSLEVAVTVRTHQ